MTVPFRSDRTIEANHRIATVLNGHFEAEQTNLQGLYDDLQIAGYEEPLFPEDVSDLMKAMKQCVDVGRPFASLVPGYNIRRRIHMASTLAECALAKSDFFTAVSAAEFVNMPIVGDPLRASEIHIAVQSGLYKSIHPNS